MEHEEAAAESAAQRTCCRESVILDPAWVGR
jgi:hypothetical protein